MIIKRTLLSPLLFTLAMIYCTTSQADVLGLKAGVNYWRAELTGEALNRTNKNAKQTPVNFDELKLTNESYNGFWLEFEHPVPVLPNLRLSYSNIESYKRIRKTTVRSGGGAVFTITQDIDTALAFNSLDATLYYEILDNWVNLDVGLTARKFDGYLDLVYEQKEGFPINTPRSYTALDEVVPMLYLKTEFIVPSTGLYFQAIANGISYQGDTFYDGEGKVGYIFDFIPGLDLNLAAGYRVMSLQTINISNLYADASMQGFMVEMSAHF